MPMSQADINTATARTKQAALQMLATAVKGADVRSAMYTLGSLADKAADTASAYVRQAQTHANAAAEYASTASANASTAATKAAEAANSSAQAQSYATSAQNAANQAAQTVSNASSTISAEVDSQISSKMNTVNTLVGSAESAAQTATSAKNAAVTASNEASGVLTSLQTYSTNTKTELQGYVTRVSSDISAIESLQVSDPIVCNLSSSNAPATHMFPTSVSGKPVSVSIINAVSALGSTGAITVSLIDAQNNVIGTPVSFTAQEQTQHATKVITYTGTTVGMKVTWADTSDFFDDLRIGVQFTPAIVAHITTLEARVAALEALLNS